MHAGQIYISYIRPIDYDNVNALLTKVNQAIAKGYHDIVLLLSSNGGQVVPGFAAFNQLQMLPIHLTTYNVGSVSSIATILFLAGTTRIAVPNATFMFHRASLEFGKSGEVVRDKLAEYISELEAYEQRIKDVLIAKTSLQPAQVELLIAEGKTKDAQFAKNFNIVQHIALFTIPSDASIVQV